MSSPAPSHKQRPTHVRFQVMAFLCTLSFLTYFDRVCIMRAQEQIQSDLGLATWQMGWILGGFWLAYALFEIPSGWLGDRIGARFTLTRIVLAWSLFTALSGTAVGFLSLFTFRFLFGAGEAGAYPNMARIQSQWFPRRSRGWTGGLLWLMARWGGAFSPVLFGTMLRAFDSPSFRDALSSVPGLEFLSGIAAWRFGFFASGLLGAVWCLAFYPWFRDNPADKRSVNHAELELIRSDQPAGEANESHAAPAGVWLALFMSPSLWAIGLLYICGSFGWSFFVSYMPKFLKEVHGISFTNSEWISALPLFLGGISCLVGGFLSDALIRRTGWRRFGRAIFPVTGCIVAAVAMVGLRYAEDSRQAVILMCLASTAFDFGQGANWASIVDIGGRYAGSATGFINMVGNMGHFLQPVIGSWILEIYSWNVLLTAYATAYLLAASMWLFIHPERRFYQVEQRPPAQKPEPAKAVEPEPI